jgi:hypothetical protein
MEPLCTGPSETLDTHKPTPMRVHARDGVLVDPQRAEARVSGVILPSDNW